MRRFMLLGVLSSLVMVLAPVVEAADWYQFRGPQTNGQADGSGYPIEWSREKNVKWHAALQGTGNGSPIVSAGHVFVTSAEDQGKKRHLYCFDRANQEPRWVRTVEYGKVEVTHETNPWAGSTPAADGERVVVWHSSAGLYCYDFDGKELWKRDLGEFHHMWGYGTSPVISGGRVFLHCGPGKQIFVIALDIKTGETLWQTDEPIEEGADGDRNAGGKYMGSWSSPVLVEVDGRLRVFCTMPTRVNAYDAETGELVWWCEGIRGPRGDLAYSSPMIGGGIGVAIGGFQGPSIGFELGGSGNATDVSRLWRSESNPQNIGTGVILGDVVYTVTASVGTMQCIEARTGKELWQGRTPGGNFWASLVLADGRLYATNQAGETHVVLPNPEKFELIATNAIGERTNSTPAFSEGEIFLRTARGLYCIATAKEE
jgi:outer membrane protein assembly factor BamB